MILARVQKARRLLDVQKSLQRIEEAKIAGLRSRQAHITALQQDLFGALNSNDGPRGPFATTFVRRLRTLSEEATGIAEELERRSLVLRTLAGRTKFVERRFRAYEQELVAARAQEELLDIIERSTRTGDASLP